MVFGSSLSLQLNSLESYGAAHLAKYSAIRLATPTCILACSLLIKSQFQTVVLQRVVSHKRIEKVTQQQLN